MKKVFFLVGILSVSALAYGKGRIATNTVCRVTSTNTVANAKSPLPVNDGRCEATTKSGNRCKRKAVRGERFCRQHLKMQKKNEEKMP